jgi:hypothetical protein
MDEFDVLFARMSRLCAGSEFGCLEIFGDAIERTDGTVLGSGIPFRKEEKCTVS